MLRACANGPGGAAIEETAKQGMREPTRWRSHRGIGETGHTRPDPVAQPSRIRAWAGPVAVVPLAMYLLRTRSPSSSTPSSYTLPWLSIASLVSSTFPLIQWTLLSPLPSSSFVLPSGSTAAISPLLWAPGLPPPHTLPGMPSATSLGLSATSSALPAG